MIPKIKRVFAREEYILKVAFDDGCEVIYNMAEDIKTLPGYVDLMEVPGLFEQVRLDESRTCLIWNEKIDLPSDIIYQYGSQKQADKP